MPLPREDDFDVRGLWEAMDAQRRSRGLTWREVMQEMTVAGVEHPMSLSTVQNLRTQDSVSCQHVLPMLKWLGRAPESFVPGRAGGTERALPAAGPDRLLRWDIQALAAALNAERQQRGFTWQRVADELACSVNQVTGLQRLRYGTAMRLAMRITRWLDRPAADFVISLKIR